VPRSRLLLLPIALLAGRLLVIAPIALLVALSSGCLNPDFHIHLADVPALQRGGDRILRLDDKRTITRNGVLVFVRGNRVSPMLFAHIMIVGDEGVCFPSSYPIATYWQGLRLDEVDPRIASRVVLPRQGLRIVQTAERSWELHGRSEALRAWVPEHLRAFEDVHRSFIDLPPITYAFRTTASWMPTTPDRLAEQARAPTAPGSGPAPRTTLLGWRWSELDRIQYFRVWADDDTPSDSFIETANAENDELVRRAIDQGTALAPGPCPITGTGKPLLDPAAAAR
jgi:hypothetical protein